MIERWPAEWTFHARQFWNRSRGRALIIVCLAAIALLAFAGVWWATRASARAPLFSAPLHPEQAIEVERALTLWNEAFSGNPAHTEIEVPAVRRHDILLRLTLAGLPHGYVPTSTDVLADASGLLLTPTLVDDRRRAGIQGDLVAGLRRLDGVLDAAVVIAPATADLLDENPLHKEASASVQLLLQPGASLSSAQIAGIARFVSAGYPALSPDRVTIVDGSGKLQLPQSAADPSLSRELRLQSSIQSALDSVLGVGAAVVRVSISPGVADSSLQTTRIVPHGVLQSEIATEHGHEQSRAFEKEHSVRRYAYDTFVERRSTPGSAGARVAVAVFLDAAKVARVSVQSIDDLVRAAAGAQLARGDDVTVRTLPFVLVQPPAGARPFNGLGTAWTIALVLVLAAVGEAARQTIVGMRHARHANTAAHVRAALQRELPQTAAYVLRVLPHDLRDQVLASYDAEYRSDVRRHLEQAGYA
ncbi:MAG: hypothetical protein M3Z37_00690 [Candidatus Eremiobacteraeota bacterium]|nr:hypothetical protein [Candidatus Eremiobacteraeota bacterium]